MKTFVFCKLQVASTVHTVFSFTNVRCFECVYADREFDPNKHCGVLVEGTGSQCTRSLTCKVTVISRLSILWPAVCHLLE